MKKRAIFLDIDGTLTIPGSSVPPLSAQQAITAARKNGHLVFLCSGRNYSMLKPLLAYGFDGYVASCGGYIVCRDQVIFDCPMTEEQKNLVMETLRNHGIYCTIECRDASYTDTEFKTFLKKHASEDGNSEFLRWREQIEKALDIRPMSDYQGEPVYKVIIMGKQPEGLDTLRRQLEPDFVLCMQDNPILGFVNGEIVNCKFDKGRAIGRVCEYLNLPLTDSIAFGDSANDREMLECAGLSVCMANGSPSIKAIADMICPPADQDGLWTAFRKLQLI